MDLVEAAAGVCDLVWLIDGRLPEMVEMAGLLRRFGPVVDIGGRSTAEIAEELADAELSGITTYLDAGMVALAELAVRLGLVFHSPSAALALIDKARQREVLAAAGLDVPVCRVVAPGPAAAAVSALTPPVTWPAVLKPRSAQGSRYTFLAADADDAVRLLDALGPDRLEMVVEDYLPGDDGRAPGPYADYVSVETLVADGQISHLAVTGRFPPAENFRETGFFVPAALGADEEEAVLALATVAIRALGVTTGCLHTEVKFTPTGPRIIEVNGRVGGGIPEMLDRAAGMPLLEWTLRIALGEGFRLDRPVATERIGYRFFLQPPAVTATVGSIDGIDAVTAYPGVNGVSVHQRPGAEVDWRDGSRNHIIAVTGAAADHEELLAADRFLRREVTVTYSRVES
jgi:biotin carboxylase